MKDKMKTNKKASKAGKGRHREGEKDCSGKNKILDGGDKKRNDVRKGGGGGERGGGGRVGKGEKVPQ